MPNPKGYYDSSNESAQENKTSLMVIKFHSPSSLNVFLKYSFNLTLNWPRGARIFLG